MARRCSFSGKDRQYGHRVSHAKNRRKHVFMANVQSRRLYIPSLKRFARVKVSTRMLRTIDKLGIEQAMKKYNVSASQILA
jgi:large subunit ribosomal protein L28